MEHDEPDDRQREVTGVVTDHRAPGYLVIELDRARFASLPEEAVASLAIGAGEVLDGARFDALVRLADVEGAYHVAMKLLAARARSVQEMLRRLRDRGHNPSAAAEAVARLEAKGLLNDREYARNFVRVRSGKGHGASRLITDLLARGVDKRLAEQAVFEILEAEEIDPIEQARALVEKRALQLGDLPPVKKRRRLLAYLGRRGYRGYEIDQLVREVLGI